MKDLASLTGTEVQYIAGLERDTADLRNFLNLLNGDLVVTPRIVLNPVLLRICVEVYQDAATYDALLGPFCSPVAPISSRVGGEQRRTRKSVYRVSRS